MPIKTPIVYGKSEEIAKDEILIGDIIQWQDPKKTTVPSFGIVIDPTTITTQSGQALGVYILPIQVFPFETIIQNTSHNYMLPRTFLRQRDVSSLNFNNNFMLEFKLIPIPLKQTHTGCDDEKIKRVGTLFNDTTGITERILNHAFRKIGSTKLMASQGRLVTQTDRFNKMSGNNIDELPEIGTPVFTEEFLNPEAIVEATIKTNPKQPKKVKVEIPKTPLIQAKKPRGELAETLEKNPDNIQGLLRTKQLRERPIWQKVIGAMPDDVSNPNITDLLMFDEDELLELRDILLSGDFDEEARLSFIRTVELYGKDADTSQLYRFITYDNVAREFQREHPKAHGYVYRALAEGQSLEEIIQSIHESDDGNIRRQSIGALVNGSYLYNLEKHDFEKAPDLVDQAEVSRAELIASLDISLEDAVEIGLIKLEPDMRKHNLAKIFNQPSEGAPKTLRQAYALVTQDEQALKGKFNRVGVTVASDLSKIITAAMQMFEDNAEEYQRNFGSDMIFDTREL